MKNFTITILILLCFLFCDLSANGFDFLLGEHNQELSSEMVQEYRKDYFIIKEFNITSLDEFEKLIEKIEVNWKTKDKRLYVQLLLTICNKLSASYYKDKKNLDFIWKYANYGLDISNEISIREEIELVKYISLINYSDDDFQKKRKEIIVKGVHAWNKLLLQLDPDWNPNERIPRGPRTNSPSFMVPNDIKNDVEKKMYEEQLKIVCEKRRNHRRQMELHRLAGDYFSKFEKTVIKLYSHSPYNNEELTNIINELPDEKVRERIVKATKDFETPEIEKVKSAD